MNSTKAARSSVSKRMLDAGVFRAAAVLKLLTIDVRPSDLIA
jgi:hypothetical protein